MARRSRRYAVAGAAQGMQSFKAEVMKQEGYHVDPDHPDDVKYEVAKEMGIPLQAGNNGNLTTDSAGQVGAELAAQWSGR